MLKHDAPQIKSVQILKVSRFWNIMVDGKLLAIVLYKRGAQSVQELIQRLAGLSVASDEGEAEETKAAKKPASKPAPKTKSKEKPKSASPSKMKSAAAKPPVKKTETEAVKTTPEPSPAAQ